MKLALCLLSILLLAASVLPQAAPTVPDLSGTWEMDLKKSRISNDEGLSRRFVVIEHKDPVIKLTWTTIRYGDETSYNEVLYTDNRKEDNGGSYASGSYDTRTVKSRSFWQKRTLIREYLFGVGLTRGLSIRYLKLDRVRFLLSEDGKKLTVATVLVPASSIGSPSMGPSTPQFSSNLEEREVYNKI